MDSNVTSLDDFLCKGVGQLYFLYQDDTSFIKGHLIDPLTHECYGFMAEETTSPINDSQCCCCQGDDKPVWYKVIIINYSSHEEFVDTVSKKGGDYASIYSEHFSFNTDHLKTGEEAITSLTKQASSLGIKDNNCLDFALMDPIICIGRFTWNKNETKEKLNIEKDEKEEVHHSHKHDGKNCITSFQSHNFKHE